MDSVQTSVFGIKTTAHDEGTFVEEMNALIEKEGDAACQAFFKLFADLDLPPYSARKYWFDIVTHRQELALLLGRDVDIVTVMSDYLHCSSHCYKNPKIVEFETFEKALEDSRHDNLTGLLNRGCFWEILKNHLAQAKRYQTEMSLLFLDVDGFKSFNDSYGHQAGDKALRAIAQVIAEQSRSGDVAIRYGGEEFVVIMPNTGEQKALVLSERIREKVEELVVEINDRPLSLTISGGIASYPVDAHDDYVLLNMADRALYQAKAMGKNMISVFADEKQRTYPRSKLIRPITIKKGGFDATPPLTGGSRNISIGGMFFETGEPLDVGSQIEVSVPVMNTDPLFLPGSVVRVVPGKNGRYGVGMAISFRAMEKAAKKELVGFFMSRQGSGKSRRWKRGTTEFTNIVEM